MKTILLVCTGNTCRSSMAEAILRKLLEDAGLSDQIQVKSAGTHAVPGQPAGPEACAVLSRVWQLDLTGHVAAPVTSELVAAADLILTMSSHHQAYIQSLSPEAVARVYSLGQFAGNSGRDVADPIGSGEAIYERVAAEIFEYLTASLPRIRDFLNLKEDER